MLKFHIVVISVFTLTTSHGQVTLTVQQVDSIVVTIENNPYIDSYTKVDSSNFSNHNQNVLKYFYKKIRETGEIVKVVRISNGTCDSKEEYYFLNSKLVKADIQMICNGKLTVESELYYFHDNAFAQTDNATPLYGPAFIQSAYCDLKRATQLDKENQ